MITYLMMIEPPADRSKFERIYLHYKGLMYHTAYKILNNEEDAEDTLSSSSYVGQLLFSLLFNLFLTYHRY